MTSTRRLCALALAASACLSGLFGLPGLAMAAESAAEPSAAAAVLAPNPNLLVQGIPAIPQALAAEVARYTDFRGHSFVDWHPVKREMLVSHRAAGGNTSQLFSLAAPVAGKLSEPRKLTDAADPVSRASYEPKQGRYIVFERANGGDEVAQLYRLNEGAAPMQLTPADERHALIGWLHAGAELIYASTPLDRTAKGGSRAEVTTTFWIVNPESSEPLQTRRKLAELPGGGWFSGQLSWDDKQLALTRYISATESEIWLMDLSSAKLRQLLPAAGDAKASYFSAGFSRDNKQLWFSSDRFGEFRELQRMQLASGKSQRVSAGIPWDASGVSFSHDGKTVAAQFNVEGRNELRLFDAASAKPLPTPRLPAGNLGAAQFDHGRGELAFSINNAQGPSQVYSLKLAKAAKAAGQAQVEAWTQSYAPPGVDTAKFPEQQIIRWKSFDGLSISGLLTQPPADKFPGKRPVLISIHGGPEGQASIGFLARNNYFVMEQGIALIQPNVRGSSGFGKTFLSLDNGFKREDSVKDIGALLDWIATQPNLDASRVLIMGGSYGGYMTLATATHYAERIAGSIDVVGISHFVTFLTNTESYRRDLRRVEYGDERDPAMRAHLEQISPLTNASKIRKPLFVVQGKNDPRVPYTEAEQIVAKVRELGTPVWYLRADNEGHGFSRKENQDFQFYSMILFMRETLLKP